MCLYKSDDYMKHNKRYAHKQNKYISLLSPTAIHKYYHSECDSRISYKAYNLITNTHTNHIRLL